MKQWIALACLLAAGNVVASFPQLPQASPSDPGTEYMARSWGVTPQEAARRLNMRNEAMRLNAETVPTVSERYAGHFYQDVPATLTLRLKGPVPKPDRTLQTPYGPLTLHFETGAAYTIDELETARESAAFKALVGSYGHNINRRTGQLEVSVPDAQERAALQAEAEAIKAAVGVAVFFTR